MTPHDADPLSERAKQAIKDGEAAWLQVSSGHWDVSSWSVMGTALTLLRAQVLREMGINKARGGPYNEAFKLRLASTEFATMESVTRSNLLYLMEPEIRVVLDRLIASWKPDERARRTHPTTLAQHVRRELKPPEPAAPATPHKAKAEPLKDADRGELSKVRLENDRLREQEAKLQARIRELEDKLALWGIASGKLPPTAADFVAWRRVSEQIGKEERAQAKAARLAQAPDPEALDPEAKAARHLRRRVNSASFTEKTKIVKALTEQTTNAAARHEGLQAWNALRTNKSSSSGKRKRW